MPAREFMRTTDRLHARVTQLVRKSGTDRAEWLRQAVARYVFVEVPLAPEEEAELEQIIQEEAAERERAEEKRQQKKQVPPG